MLDGLLDTHAHFDAVDDPDAAMRGVAEAGGRAVWVCTEPEQHEHFRARAQPAVVTVAPGFHPQAVRAGDAEGPRLALLLSQIAGTKTPWIGEIGLDGQPQFADAWTAQVAVLDAVLEAVAASPRRRAVTLHARRASTAVLDALERHPAVLHRHAPVMHWFSGTDAELERATALGCWFSVNPRMVASGKRRATVRRMPRDRVLLETDAPFGGAAFAGLADVVIALSGWWGISRAETREQILRNQTAAVGELPLRA